MRQAIEKIISNSSQIKSNEGDYLQGGLLYCGKCNTPKQVRINVFGTERTPMCLCKCEIERRKAEEDAERRAAFKERVRKLRQMGFPDSEMEHWTFDKDDHCNEQISSVAKRYVDNFGLMKAKGKGLLLFGQVGTGKTFISACIANALIEQGHPCLVTNFARLVNMISGQGGQDYIDNLNKFDLIVIDDLASERDTEYMGEIVQSIIDARYRSGLPLIITTNLTAIELKHPADIRKQRIYSRLFEMCIPVEVKGGDRRIGKLKTDYQELKDILGL